MAALLVLSLAALYYVGWTESGLQLLASKASHRIGPVTMELRGARGTLADGAHLEGFILDHRRVHIEARNVDLRLSVMALFWGAIRIEEARVDTLVVRVLKRVDQAGAWKPRFLRAPMTLEVGNARVAHGTLIATNNRAFDASDLVTSGIVRAYSIRVYSSVMQYSGMTVTADGEVRATTPLAMTGALRFEMTPQGQPAWLANAAIDGNLDRLAITGAITQPFSADFRGEALTLTTNWHWQGSSQVKRFDLTAWGAGNALGIIAGELRLSGDREAIRASGALTPSGLQSGPLQVAFTGNYANKVVSAQQIELLHRPSGTVFTARGDIGIVENGPRLDLRGRWQNLRWPLSDAKAPIHSMSGQYSLSGLWPFALQAAGELQVQQLPPMRFVSEATLGKDHLDARKVTLDAYDGRATLSGTAAWKPQERWQVSGTMDGLNVERLRPGFAGRLNFAIKADGTGFGAGRMLRSEFTSISGTIRGQRAGGRAGVELAGDDWLLHDVRLQLGATRLAADGRIGQQTELKFDIAADDLGLLQPEARGHLQARGSIGGELRNPALQLEASGDGIVWNQLAAGKLTASVHFDPRGGRADARVSASEVKLGERSLTRLQFDSTGTVAAHQVSLDAASPDLQLHATGDGSFADGIWRWRLMTLGADDHRQLQLTLQAPATLELGVDHVRLERLCLHDAQAQLCGSGSIIQGQRQFTVLASNLPMRALTASIASSTEFDGTLTIEASGSSTADARWQGKAHAQLASAAVRHRFVSGRTETFNLGTGTVNVDLAPTSLVATASLDAAAAGKVNGRIEARGNATSWRNWPLSGNLELETDALDVLDSYVTQIDRASGRLNAQLMLGGTLGTPQLSGELNVRNAQIDAYQINLALRDLNFDARMDDNRLTMDGSATAGVDGKARFNGQLAWRQGLPYGKLHLEGEDLRIVNIPEARVQASPNVDMNVNGRRIDVTGTVTLPYARLEQPEELATAVRASGDEIIVTANQAPRAETFRVYSNVTLKLGERVTINTSGLSGRLSGSITASNDDTGFSRGSGELNVEEGKYTAYGRKLDIVRGRLIFNNSPLGDPGVDLRAAKKFPDITAGVNVRGTLSAPRMTFYSEPAVSQSQIVSILLAGGSVDRLQSSAADTDRNAAQRDMLLQGSAILAQQFGNRVGIEDVSVETNLQNDTSLVLGRYLSPRLYISYGISLAEALNTFKLTYTISDKWALRTETGADKKSGADLVFTLKR